MPQASRCSHLTLSVDLWLTICFTLIVNLHYITLIVQRHFGSLEDRPLSSPTFVMFFNDTHITFTVHLTEYSPHILPTWRKMNQFSFIWIHRRGAAVEWSFSVWQKTRMFGGWCHPETVNLFQIFLHSHLKSFIYLLFFYGIGLSIFHRYIQYTSKILSIWNIQ